MLYTPNKLVQNIYDLISIDYKIINYDFVICNNEINIIILANRYSERTPHGSLSIEREHHYYFPLSRFTDEIIPIEILQSAADDIRHAKIFMSF